VTVNTQSGRPEVRRQAAERVCTCGKVTGMEGVLVRNPEDVRPLRRDDNIKMNFKEIKKYRLYLGRAMAQAVSRRHPTAEDPVRSRGQSMWDLWWTKWHCDRFLPEYLGFALSVSFHRCSITKKRIKNHHHHHHHHHHRVAQKASRLRCVRSLRCGALHH
jgi:hypothetical protein